MSKNSFKIKKGITLTPVDPSTIVSPEVGDLVVDSTDGNKLKAYDGAAFGAVASGQGGINYLEGNNSDFESGIGNWAAIQANFTTASTTVVPTQETGSPLRGAGSLKITATSPHDSAAVRLYSDFTIDAADLAKKMIISFDYDCSDVNYSDGKLQVQIIKDRAGTPEIIRVNGEDLMAGKGTHYASFQTDATETSYSLALLNTDDISYTVYIDNVKVGPQVIQHGAIVTDWEDYTLSAAGGITLGNATVKSKYRRVGDSIEVRGEVTFGTTTSISGDVYFNHPNGLDVDTSKITEVSNSIVGSATLLDSGVENLVGVVTLGADYAIVRYITATGGTSTTVPEHALLSATAPFTWTTNDKIVFEYKVPITGFSSTAKMSEDFSGREIYAHLFRSSSFNHTSSGAYQQYDLDAAIYDSVGAFDSANNKYVIPESGVYTVIGNITWTSLAATKIGGAAIGVNGSATYLGNTFSVDTTGVHRQNVTITQYFAKGTDITLMAYQNDSASEAYTTSNGQTFLMISKIPNPQTMLENEAVIGSFNDGSGLPINTGAYEKVTWDTVLVDTHNAMSSGVYTVPVTGNYSISGMIMMELAAVWDGVDYLGIKIYKNGTTNLNSIERRPYSGELYAGITLPAFVVPLNKGDTIQLQVYQNTPSNRNLLNSAVRNSLTIYRVK